MIKICLISIIGVLLILAGIFVPPSAGIEALRKMPEDVQFREKLLLGAILFKIGLAGLGVLCIVISKGLLRDSKNQQPVSHPREDTRLTKMALAVILLIAAALRLHALDLGLWYDEIMTCVRYVRMPFGEIITTYDSENQHFLYTILAHASWRILGENAISLRLPAVLFGVASIWALYIFARLIANVRIAFLSATLLTFSYYHIWFSQNARGYTGLLFWTILSSWLLLRAIRENKRILWFCYAITVALGVYTQMTMLLVVMGHFIIWLKVLFDTRKSIWPNRWDGLLVGFLLAGLFTFQLHSLALPQILSTIGQKGTVSSWNNPVWTIVQLFRGLEISFASSIAAVAALIVFVAGMLSFWRREPIAIQLLVVPTLIGIVVTIAMQHPLWPRFFFFEFGFAVLILVAGMMLIGEWTVRFLKLPFLKGELAGTILTTVLILLSILSIPAAYSPKQDYAGAMIFVEKNKQPGDAVVTIGRVGVLYSQFYKTNWQKAESLEALNQIRSRAKRTWVLYIIPLDVQALYPEIMQSIKRDFKLVKEFHGSLQDGTIFVCRSDRSV